MLDGRIFQSIYRHGVNETAGRFHHSPAKKNEPVLSAAANRQRASESGRVA
ncbi:MAG: hypothetical protein M3362_05355 [Acidobacteriota bacterium]|nr:hypothetical protein [Acidobacteriota bacterium]